MTPFCSWTSAIPTRLPPPFISDDVTSSFDDVLVCDAESVVEISVLKIKGLKVEKVKGRTDHCEQMAKCLVLATSKSTLASSFSSFRTRIRSRMRESSARATSGLKLEVILRSDSVEIDVLLLFTVGMETTQLETRWGCYGNHSPLLSLLDATFICFASSDDVTKVRKFRI